MRLNTFRYIFVINQATMAASASASASAPASAPVIITRVELVNKTQLQRLLTQVNSYVDDTWCRQVTGAIRRCIDAYDDDQGGYSVEYRQKAYDGKAMGPLWASHIMQCLYKLFRGGHRQPYGACRLGHAQCPPGVPFAGLRAPWGAFQALHGLRWRLRHMVCPFP